MVEEERLPPGFRFHPTDEELITYYLRRKITESSFSARAIAEADLNKCEPWDLPGKAKMGEKEWYFFSLRDRKYPTGVRTNRATNSGYWKTTGKDREIFNGNSTELVGMKKTLVFYKGRAPRGEKSNWVMHEYRLHSKATFKGNKDEWVVCRIFVKSSGAGAAATGKKHPSSNQPRPNHCINLDSNVGASIMPSLLPNHPSHFTAGGRHLPASTAAELVELSKFARANHGGGLSLPILPHLNYTGGFTLSGLNLNLGARPAPAPVLGGMQTPPPPQPQVLMAPDHHQQINPAFSSCIMGIDGGFSADVDSTASGNRYQNMDPLDFEGYWPSY